MRICLLSKEYAPHSSWGPLGAYNYHLAQELRSLDHDIEVITLSSSGIPADTCEQLEDGITVHRLSHSDKMTGSRELLMSTPASHFMLKTNLSLWNKLLQLHQQKPFDVLEVSDRLAEGVLPAVCKILPVVIRVHEPYAQLMSKEPCYAGPSFDHHFIALMERLASISATAIIATTESSAAFLQTDLNLQASAIHLLESATNEMSFRQIASESETVYKQAVEQYALRAQTGGGIYQRSAQQSIADASNLIYAYQEMLYNLLFAQSWRFRIRHWALLASSNPQLFAWKIVVQVASRLLGAKAGESPYLLKLSQEIAATESHERQKRALEMGCLP